MVMNMKKEILKEIKELNKKLEMEIKKLQEEIIDFKLKN